MCLIICFCTINPRIRDLINYYLEGISFTCFFFQAWEITECSTPVFSPQIQYFYFCRLIPSYRPILKRRPTLLKVNKIFLCWSIILAYLPHFWCRTDSTPFLFCFLWVLNEHFVVHFSLPDFSQLSSLHSIFSLVISGCYLFPIFCTKWLFFCADMEPQCAFLLTWAASIRVLYSA